MKSLINYYYNLYPENIQKMYGGYYFDVNNVNYLLTELKVPAKQTLDIYQELMNNRLSYFLIISNKDGSPVSIFEEKEYILYHLNCDYKETLKFGEQLYIPYPSDLNWGALWTERINYYEVQINELAQEKKLILDSVNYYIGLAENAIFIANKFYDGSESYIQHYRIGVPVKYADYFNPTNLVGDVYVRDIAEYIKSSFFSERREVSFYIEYLSSFNYSPVTANLLMARLLYPSYYFDTFDEIILNDKPENHLLPVLNMCYEFEELLAKIYLFLEQKYQIEHINWLKKRAIALR